MCSVHLTHPKCTHTWSSGQLQQCRAADTAATGEQLGVWCLAQGSHLSRGQFLPEPRFEHTTSYYKSNALSTRPRLPPWVFGSATGTLSLSDQQLRLRQGTLSTNDYNLHCRTLAATSGFGSPHLYSDGYL